MSNSSSGTADVHATFSVDGPYDEIFVGDWNGDGKDTIATRVGRSVYIRNENSGPVEKSFSYAEHGDEFIVGDWNGDGVDTFAVRRGNSYHLKYTLEGGWAARIVHFGDPQDEVHVGDWDGDGDDTLAIRRGNRTMFMNGLESEKPVAASWYGLASDPSMVGDWDGDGRDTLAIRRGAFHLTNSLSSGRADAIVHLGSRGADTALVGDWDGDGRDSFGLRLDAIERDDSDAARGDDREPVDEAPAIPAGVEHSDGKPGPDSTGVPAGTVLEVHHGDLDIREPGTVIDGLDVRGYVRVRAEDVVIRNSVIRGGTAGRQDGLIKVIDGGASLLIEDSELAAADPNPGIDGLKGWNITARRVNIHSVIDGGHFWGSNVTVENSWIHDLLHYRNDPNHSDGSHDDGIQIQQGSNIRITG
ncbi:right-handed parallel beta-helix repeat-containing protein, partial [Georgenia sp. 10Sc9-8]|nr:right-handed parallel beta-helix repeat-containing protein [Georgenia halotolerans]